MTTSNGEVFDKFYVIDTNIILQDAQSLMTLSDNSQNLIILPETVLDELDSKKTGFDEINYQAREFARLLSDAEVISMDSGNDIINNGVYKVISLNILQGYNVRIDIISKDSYTVDTQGIASNILNDRKILEIARFAQHQYLNKYEDVDNKPTLEFLSFDIMARIRALSLNIKTSTLKGDNSDTFDYEFHKTISLSEELTPEEVNDTDINTLDPENKCHNFSYSFKLPSGREILACNHQGKLEPLVEDEVRRQAVSPKNKEQLFFSNAILENRYQVLVVDAKAGCVTRDSKVKIRFYDTLTAEIKMNEINEYLDMYGTVEVNTDTGYQRIKGYNEKGLKECYLLSFEDGFSLECSYDHFIFDTDDKWWSPENLIIDSHFLQRTFHTTEGPKNLLSIESIGEHTIVDLEVDSEDHRYYTNGILSHNSGKTLLALSGAMKMVRKKEYSKIVYIRNSIESVDKGEEVGFLSGNDEKFQIYNHPLMDSIEYIVRSEMKKSINNKAHGKGSDITPAVIQDKVEDTIARYAIETMWNGELRGRTLSDAVVIIDEAQNMSNKTLQLVLTRIDSSCKVIVLGSNRQIDNFYINKHTNGLSTLLNSTQKKYDGINVFSIQLDKVLRGPITEWAEKVFTGE